MTMLSRILGLVRDVVVASYFGASANADAFFVAFKIPNFMRRLFAEGAFAQAFVPVLSEYRTQRDHRAVKDLLNRVAGTWGTVLVGFTAFAVLCAPYVAALFAPGFYMEGGAKFDLAVDMLRITFPYLLLISMTAFAGSVLNSYGRFAVPAFTPVLLNVTLIGSAVFLSPLFDPPILAMAWGVLIAGLVQFMFQLPFLSHLKLVPKPIYDRKDEGVRRIYKLMLPAMFGVSVTQINLLLDTVLASFLETGSVSWLYYSDRLAELPLGVFGIAIATVILPSLSRKHASASREQFSATLDWAIRMVLLIGVPAGVALFLLAAPMITTLFHYGELTGHDVERASLSLQAYACGVIAFMLIKVLATGYFSRQDTATPVKIGIQASVANMVFNLLLIGPFAHVGLAAATSMSAFMNAGLLFWGLKKSGVLVVQKGWGMTFLRIATANGLMAATLVYLAKPDADWLTWGVYERVSEVAILVGAGLLAYLVGLWVTGLRPRHLKPAVVA
ncbi:MAG: murein biosynthesis integral membrane protein MurJ [Pontibacterium sp.]